MLFHLRRSHSIKGRLFWLSQHVVAAGNRTLQGVGLRKSRSLAYEMVRAGNRWLAARDGQPQLFLDQREDIGGRRENLQALFFKHIGIAVVTRYPGDGVFSLALNGGEEGGTFLIEQVAGFLIEPLDLIQKICQVLPLYFELAFCKFYSVTGRELRGLGRVISLHVVELLLQCGLVLSEGGIGLFRLRHGIDEFVEADAGEFALGVGGETDANAETAEEQG